MQSWKKYYQMTFFGFLGLSLYLFISPYYIYMIFVASSLFTSSIPTLRRVFLLWLSQLLFSFSYSLLSCILSRCIDVYSWIQCGLD